jgi:hypothetical protein
MDWRIPTWVVDGVEDLDVPAEVVAAFRLDHGDQVHLDPGVTAAQRAVYDVLGEEQLRAAGGFGPVLATLSPAELILALDGANLLELRDLANHLDAAITLVFPDGLPTDEASESAAWERFPWRYDHYDFGGLLDPVDAESPTTRDVRRAIAAYIRGHTAAFFVEPRSLEADVRDRLTFAGHLERHAPDRVGRARRLRILTDALALSEELGDRQLAAACRAELDRPVAPPRPVPSEPDPTPRPMPGRSRVQKHWRPESRR